MKFAISTYFPYPNDKLFCIWKLQHFIEKVVAVVYLDLDHGVHEQNVVKLLVIGSCSCGDCLGFRSNIGSVHLHAILRSDRLNSSVVLLHMVNTHLSSSCRCQQYWQQ